MRAETDRAKLELFMIRLGEQLGGPGRIYFAGGATALLYGWRDSTIDIDIKPDPEPAGLFEAIAEIKDALDLNVELAAPDQFIPPLPGWRERSLFIARHRQVEFRHYDFYAQALAKLSRGYQRDQADVNAMLASGLIEKPRCRELFGAIEAQLVRFPALDAAVFRRAVEVFCHEPE